MNDELITKNGHKDNDKKSFLQILKENKNGWIVCLNVIILHLIRTGLFNSFGIFIAEFRKLYGTPMAVLNWITLTAVFLAATSSPLTTVIIKFTPKNGHFICSLFGSWCQALACLATSFVVQIEWMFLTYGIMFGVSCSLSLMSSTLILNEFFPVTHKYHVFATSIFQCAFPAGILIFATFYAWLIETITWRWAIRVAGLKLLVFGTICSFSYLLEKPNYERNVDNTGKSNCRYWIDVFKNPVRICWLLGILLTYATQVSFITNLPHYLSTRGFGTVEAGFVITILGVAQFLSYAVIPLCGQLLPGKLVYTNIVSCLIIALFLLIWPFTNPSYGTILFFSAAIGVFGAASFAFIYPGSGEAMEMELDVAWTITCTVSGFGALMGPLISGLVYDYTNSYDIVFYVLASVTFADFLVFLMIPTIKYFRRQFYEGLA